jgi:hypothetical protein
MAATLKVVDEQFGAGARVRRPGVDLRLASERVSAREIIRSRVAAEVEELNARKQGHDQASGGRSYMVQADAERKLNPASSSAWIWRKPLDVEAEVRRAMAAFEARRFIMLLDELQIDDLDAAVGLRTESEVVFLHLTPLKGG